jgi:DNA-binding response OmpR family regulator
MISNLLKRSSKDTQTFSALIIHDDMHTALKISECLVNQGHQVLAANSSDEAMQLLNGAPLPDIFIMDLHSPEVEGKVFLETARIRFGRSALPPVLILADASQDEQIARQMSADDVLPKPFEDSELLSRLTALVEARRPKEQKAPAHK